MPHSSSFITIVGIDWSIGLQGNLSYKYLAGRACPTYWDLNFYLACGRIAWHPRLFARCSCTRLLLYTAIIAQHAQCVYFRTIAYAIDYRHELGQTSSHTLDTVLNTYCKYAITNNLLCQTCFELGPHKLFGWWLEKPANLVLGVSSWPITNEPPFDMANRRVFDEPLRHQS